MAAASAKEQFTLTDGVYRVETRLNIESLRDTVGSRFVLALYNKDGNSLPLVRFEKDGSFEVQTANGWKSVGTFDTAKWYRLGLLVDMDAGIYAAYLMDDNYNALAAGGAQSLGATTITGM